MPTVRRRSSVISTSIRISHHPVLKGIGSLSVVPMRNPMFTDYMAGSDMEDMARDWASIGRDFQVAIGKVMR